MNDLPQLTAAWDWVLRLRDDKASPEDLSAWLEWYEADERNKVAFEEMQALWRQTGRLDVQQLLNSEVNEPQVAPAHISLGKALSWGRGLALAASLAVFAIGAVVYLASGKDPNTIAAGDGLAVVRQEHLPDGSRVELASRSSVSVRYTKHERVLEMKTGEAFFSVAPHPERPFIVKIGGLRVRALGTAFNIRQAGRRTVVTVTEGKVRVDVPARLFESDRSASAVTVSAGNQLMWPDRGAKPVLTAMEPGRALSWKSGRLEYLNEPLAAVIADLNRYSAHPAVLGDEQAGEILFTGAVLTDATEHWLRAIPDVFPLKVETAADGAMTIRSVERQ